MTLVHGPPKINLAIMMVLTLYKMIFNRATRNFKKKKNMGLVFEW